MDNLYTKSITKPTLLHFTGLVCVCVCVRLFRESWLITTPPLWHKINVAGAPLSLPHHGFSKQISQPCSKRSFVISVLSNVGADPRNGDWQARNSIGWRRPSRGFAWMSNGWCYACRLCKWWVATFSGSNCSSFSSNLVAPNSQWKHSDPEGAGFIACARCWWLLRPNHGLSQWKHQVQTWRQARMMNFVRLIHPDGGPSILIGQDELFGVFGTGIVY